MPEHIHLQQQQMLDALHRQKHQDLHKMMHKKQQAAAGGDGTASGAATAAAGAGSSAAGRTNGSLTDADVLHAQHSKWPEGYLAICAVVKDQNRDLRYWIEYHRWLGVGKFYIMDNNSSMPAMMVLWDYISSGLVDYQYFVGRPRTRPIFTETNQYKAYQGCLLQHFRQHRWLAFIDIDEFFRDGENTHVKVVANTGGVLGLGMTPHEILPRPGRTIVDVDGVPFKGPKTKHAKWHKLVIHHYVLKSRAEFAGKHARGSGAGNVKGWEFFNFVDGISNSSCSWGQGISRAFFASRPRLRPPKGSHLCSLRSKQLVAAAAAAGAAVGLQEAGEAVDAAGQQAQQQQPQHQQPQQQQQQQQSGDGDGGTDGAADSAAEDASSAYAEQE
ncbi:hypothetical protein OEZ86_009904 [Tetradesmus obliquus]|uniref:Glycosyltransferase family 92 protein n=1 Tax=Tetradesmus obliquus TaxID=3088 RepID=A0ABY8URJ9_TETOB|nr:hypothetical protein OEZ85_001341 [Tetradesmus obliquus]WIA43436.1 hypothetical protein OEZ86_009904 [Tetradesmus obliquus]